MTPRLQVGVYGLLEHRGLWTSTYPAMYVDVEEIINTSGVKAICFGWAFITLHLCVAIHAETPAKPLFNITEFLNTSDIIWTLFGTGDDKNVTCKKDYNIQLNGTEVHFKREYMKNGSKASLSLQGTVGVSSHMNVYPEGTDQIYTTIQETEYQIESLEFLNPNKTCAIIKTTLRSGNGARTSLCEARLKTNKANLTQTFEYCDCMNHFQTYCSNSSVDSVYSDTC